MKKKHCGYRGKLFTASTKWVKYCSAKCGHLAFHDQQLIRNEQVSKHTLDEPVRRTVKLSTGLEILNNAMAQEIYRETKYWSRK